MEARRMAFLVQSGHYQFPITASTHREAMRSALQKWAAKGDGLDPRKLGSTVRVRSEDECPEDGIHYPLDLAAKLAGLMPIPKEPVPY